MQLLKSSLVSGLLLAGIQMAGWAEEMPLRVPRLAQPATIDGDLSDWKDLAFSDGVWTMERLRQTPWYDPERNRLTLHGEESPGEDDLLGTYYAAWDDTYLYLGAEVRDNVNDVEDPEHEDKRWYYKDCVCWFVEAPRDARSERFGQGDNAFCFVIDASRPSYGAWWRHGGPGLRYVEEPLPTPAVEYELRMNPWGQSDGDFILEARVQMESTLGQSDPDWTPPREGDVYGLEIVHTDPDGGEYGGHFLIYGAGDDDATWGEMVLADEVNPTAVDGSAWGRIKLGPRQ